MPRILLRLLVVALITAGLSAAMLFALQRQMIYPGTGPDTGLWNNPPAGYETVTLQTGDGLDLKALYRAPAKGQPTLLFFHGNGDNALSSARLLAPVIEGGRGALLVNYRGYAGNPGSPSEEGLYADGAAGAAFLSRQGIDPNSTVVGGFSLGTGVASEIAVRAEYKGVFLISPFTSMRDAASHHFPWLPASWLVSDHYPTKERIARIGGPMLIIHGAKDRIIPAAHARALAELRPDAQLELVEGAGHNDMGGKAQPILAGWLARL